MTTLHSGIQAHKAEKALKEQLKRVDVVLEVRDARFPQLTIPKWLSGWVARRRYWC